MFSDIFEKACIEAGIAPTRLLIELGIGKSALSNWKRGSEPSNRTKNQIADYFGVSVKDFMDGKIKKAPAKAEADDEMISILQDFKDNPELRTLFLLSKSATPAQLKQYADVIRALRGSNSDISIHAPRAGSDKHINPNKIISNLAKYRIQAGLTQQQLADLTGISIRTIQKWESGERDIKKAQINNILALAEVLGVEPEDLL